MSVERNFEKYVLGDNVYKLATDLIPEIAELLEVPISDTPNSEDLGKLVGAIGKNKVLRDNQELTAISQADAALMVDRSGVQMPLSRSLWTPHIGLPDKASSDGLTATIITGAVANWQDRTRVLLEADPVKAKLYAVTGKRIMNTGTELSNPHVANFIAQNGREPSETEYASMFVLPEMTGRLTEHVPYATVDGDEIAKNFIRDNPELFADGIRVSFARVANAGIQLAVQFRKAARAVNPGYDSNPDKPQVFVQTDTFPLARTAEELKDPANYQSPFTALRQVAVTAKMLHEASQL